jgi:hypothetical protein
MIVNTGAKHSTRASLLFQPGLRFSTPAAPKADPGTSWSQGGGVSEIEAQSANEQQPTRNKQQRSSASATTSFLSA